MAGPPEATASAIATPRSRVLFTALNALAVLAAVAQVFIEPVADNLIAVATVLGAALLTLQYLERSRGFDDAPVSSLALLGLCVTTQWTSLVAQTFAGIALVEGLQQPIRTFALLSGVQALAVAVHWIYRRFAPLQTLRGALTHGVLEPLGAFQPLAPPAVWMLGLIGAASVALGGNAETGDAGLKFLQALSFFAWMPVMIPLLYARHGRSYCVLAAQTPFLIGYAVLLMGIGMALNVRQLMLIGPIQLLLVLAIYGLRDRRPASGRMLMLMVASAIGAGAFTYAARDVATAMVVVREQKESLGPMQILEETLAALGDPGKLELYRDKELAASRAEMYDENYLDNPLLARFSETKFHDNMLSMLLRLNESERESIAEVTWIKIVAVLPQPVLDRLELGIDKERYEFSIGDYYRSLIESDQFFGGYATGSMWVDLLAVFGVWSPIVTIGLLLVLYVLLDMLSIHDRDGGLLLSAVAVCTAWAIFLYGLGAESISAKVTWIVRGLPEKILLYCIAAALLRQVFPWRPASTTALPEDAPAGRMAPRTGASP